MDFPVLEDCAPTGVGMYRAGKGGQFVLHAKALHANPYDGHTLGPVKIGRASCRERVYVLV